MTKIALEDLIGKVTPEKLAVIEVLGQIMSESAARGGEYITYKDIINILDLKIFERGTHKYGTDTWIIYWMTWNYTQGKGIHFCKLDHKAYSSIEDFPEFINGIEVEPKHIEPCWWTVK